MQPKRLGKGLGALMETAEAEVAQLPANELQVVDLPIDAVYANPDQPRKEFDADALGELSQSILEKGVIQPILVLRRADGRFMIIAGERRFRASKLAGKTSIPAIVRQYSDEETMEVALIENLQRENLNPLEEALAFRNLIERFGLSQEEIAQKIGKNRATVANSLRLLKLPEGIQAGIAANTVSAGHARALLAVKGDDAAREALYKVIIDQGLSVRDAEWIAQAINGGAHFGEAVRQRLDRGADAPAPASEERDAALERARGATVLAPAAEPASPVAVERLAPELWELQERLIEILGTKVQLKGTAAGGKIEITWFSADDLDRIYDIFRQGR